MKKLKEGSEAWWLISEYAEDVKIIKVYKCHLIQRLSIGYDDTVGWIIETTNKAQRHIASEVDLFTTFDKALKSIKDK